MERQKRALAIHDISGFGKCSLTVALPILSAAGVECSCMPTAVLSTHTGGFSGYTYRDLTEDILPMARHWENLGVSFDALYTGYLGSAEQIDLVLEVFERLGQENCLRLVDPVMADFGRLYAGFSPDFPAQMKRLCAKADVIIPNITEATLMLGKPYREGPFERSYVEELLAELAELGPRQVVLTGMFFDDGEQLGSAAWENGEVSYAFAPRIEGQYHGSGDVWGSALLAALMNGRNLNDACRIACEYTSESVALTRASQTDDRFGLRFETALPSLMKKLELV